MNHHPHIEETFNTRMMVTMLSTERVTIPWS